MKTPAATRYLGLLLVLLGFASNVFAHPGHDLFAHGYRHALASPTHAIVLFSCALPLLGVSWAVRSARARRILRCAGSALLCGAIAMWTVSL